MKKTLTALMFGSFALVGIAGCGEKTEVTKETQVSTPGGTATTRQESSVKTTGDNPPAPAPTP